MDSEDQSETLEAVRQFVGEKIIPVASELEYRDEYPTEIVEGLKELGTSGLMYPEKYDGLSESLLTYALCVEEIGRGWRSVSGVIIGSCGCCLRQGTSSPARRRGRATQDDPKSSV